jgi:hypothetical protein
MNVLSKKNLKKSVIKILEEALDKTETKKSSSKDQNVVLVSVLYKNLTDKIDHNNVAQLQTDLENNKTFNAIIVVSVQKNTFEKVEEFLKQEANSK